MATAQQRIAGSRPRTLTAAIVPVMIGSGSALITVLGQTSRLQLAFGIAFTIGLAIHI